MYYEQKKEAFCGDLIGVNISGIPSKLLKRGCVIGEADNNPPRAVESFTAMIVILSHPNQVKAGFTPIMYCHTASFACKIT